MKRVLIVLCLAAMLAAPYAGALVPRDGYPKVAIGADLSWTQRLTDMGAPKYYLDPSGEPVEIYDMVGHFGLDAVRLRVWVDPEGTLAKAGFEAMVDGVTVTSSPTYGYCTAADVGELCDRYCGDMGMRVMLCFQLSDTWADPSRQYIPQAWSDCRTVDELAMRASSFIINTIDAINDRHNIEWVQIGNETSTGMLKYLLPEVSGGVAVQPEWGCGIADNSEASVRNFVTLFSACASAVKKKYPSIHTVMHLAEGNSWDKISWTLGLLEESGFSSEMCDVVGLSLYPCSEGSNYDKTALWQADADACLATMAKLHERGYGTMLCEIGMNNEWSLSTPQAEINRLGSQAANIAQCSADVEAFTEYLFAELGEGQHGCEGIFYWEPEVDYLDNYTKGACVSMTPGPAWPRDKVVPNAYWSVCMAHSDFPAGGLYFPGGIEGVGTDHDGAPEYFNLQGIRLPAPDKGLMIERRGATTRKIVY